MDQSGRQADGDAAPAGQPGGEIPPAPPTIDAGPPLPPPATLAPGPASVSPVPPPPPPGWSAGGTPPLPGPPGAVPPAYGPGPGATVAWAPPVAAGSGIPVPGAPGLQFGRVLDRFLAWFLDGIVVGLGSAFAAGILAGLVPGSTSATNLLTAVIYLGIGFLYFAGMWTSAGRATIGMRVLKLQVGNAFDGRTLTMAQATRRWLALGLPLQGLSFLPAASGPIASITLLWSLALLVSTAISPTRQGLHDRFANSAMVQPMGASTPALACLILLLLLIVIPVIAIFALVFLGAQISDILSSAGTSVTP